LLLSKNVDETSRPTLYRGLKYWGKKPHNVWREFILQYTRQNDIVYDPFAGSGLTFFEAIKTCRKPVVADINPLTLFLINIYSKNFNSSNIILHVREILKKAKNTTMYKKNFIGKCSNCGELTDIYNYRVENNIRYARSYKCSHCKKTITDNIKTVPYDTTLNLWKPNFKLKQSSSITPIFINKIGGNSISNLWTERNVELLSLIFNEISSNYNSERDALMFAFLQTVHLTTKMCALRSEETNRPLSTSWGRPAFLGLKSYMEQNPVLQFEKSIFGNAGVIKCLKSRMSYLPNYTYAVDVRAINDVDGIVMLRDSKKINNGFIADFILTDPPYGSIIQYGELSQVWNVWLEKFSNIYKVSLNDEIVANRQKKYEKYITDMIEVFTNCHRLLVQDGTMVLTFNSNTDADWQALNSVITHSGFYVNDSQYQKNKRSSEANVLDKEGIGISDFYFSIKHLDGIYRGLSI
jgi:DNA modification methylase